MAYKKQQLEQLKRKNTRREWQLWKAVTESGTLVASDGFQEIRKRKTCHLSQTLGFLILPA